MLSIDVSFVSKFFWKGDKNFKNLTSGRIYMEDPVDFQRGNLRPLCESRGNLIFSEIRFTL